MLIGENNTGKTHLLKLIYVLCPVDKFMKNEPEPNQEELERFLIVSIQDSGSHYFKTKSRIPVFIPTKEVLSFMEGMTSLYDRYNLAFDETYRDLFSSLNLPTIRSEIMQAEIRKIIEAIEAIYGGKFIFYEGGRVTFKAQDIEYSSNAVAEGFRIQWMRHLKHSLMQILI